MSPIKESQKKFSLLTHLKHVKQGHAGVIPDRRSAEIQLKSALKGKDTLDWHQVQKAIRNHRQAFHPTPEHAMLKRPEASGIQVRLPSGSLSQAHLFHDLDGRVEARLLDVQRGGFPYSLQPTATTKNSTPRLSVEQIDEIRDMRSALETGCMYSTLAPALALCRAVRQAGDNGQLPLRFADALAHLELSGEQLVAHYGGATCFSLAEILRDKVEAKFGLKAYVVSERIANLIALRPSPVKDGTEANQEVLKHMEADTHTNVLIPYRDEDDEVCYLKINSGGGPSLHPEDAVQVVDPASIGFLEHLEKTGKPPPKWNYKRMEAPAQQVVIGNPRRLVVQSLVGPPKLNMRNWVTGAVCGVDLLRRRVYLNEKATAPGLPGLQIDLTDPRATGQLDLFLSAVQEIFGLDRKATTDLRFLCTHLDTFCDEVLFGPTSALQICIHARDAAVSWREPVISLWEQKLPASLPTAREFAARVAEGNTSLGAAAKALGELKGAEAKKHYDRAYTSLHKAHALLRDGLRKMEESDLQKCISMVYSYATHNNKGELLGDPTTSLIVSLRQENTRRQHVRTLPT
jgi:hypothetical protein